MKMKLNVNGSGIKRAVMAHGEKVLFGVSFLLLMLFGYNALTREKLPSKFEPPQLEAKVQAARGTIESATLKVEDEGIIPHNYNKVVATSTEPDKYAKNIVLYPPVKDAGELRDDPQVFPLEKPLAGAGRGIYSATGSGRTPRRALGRAAAAPAARGTNEGKFWAVVTALVPVGKQEEEFHRALAGVSVPSTGKDADVPKYGSLYVVQRAEVTGEGADNLKWVTLNVATALKQSSTWGSRGGDMVAEKYIHDVFTMPLMPVEFKWDESIAHPPEIPIASKVSSEEPSDDEVATEDAPANAAEDAPMDEPGIFGTGDDPPIVEPKEALDDEKPEYQLFRFFDDTVQQGKQYRYRMQIGLLNPNFNVELKYLKNKESATKKGFMSAWSEPTPVVAVPVAEQVFAGPIDKANKPGEPLARVMVTKLDTAGGFESVGIREVTRGHGIVVTDATYKDPATGTVKSVSSPVNAKALVVDIDGGEQLSGREKLIEPVSVLILNPQGMIEAHHELDDAVAYRARDPKGGESRRSSRSMDREEENSDGERRGSLLDRPNGRAETRQNRRRTPRTESSPRNETSND